ncbi:IclR family transcriptional regulator [Actibacterium sp. 188UL27-1]|uniref:IclR family transcriptional regulator n=1 Tax=Actibacterium sp. 188UL27-1 TaxID=2786961 RepID=UPI00195E135B|nr:IclR family transcriptional regulator [Actibacterium sp. 188UL27-1]MBM7067390.1 IclR family transcriptional regulator [Actibacterium sp. 188UL27-1]
MAEDGSAAKTDQIPTNLRLLLLLEEVVRAGEPVTPTEVNANLGLPKPTIHRLFRRLEDEGFLQRDLDGRSYSPGRRLRRLSINTLSARHIRMARLAILKMLADSIGETCNIAVPDRDDMVYLDRVETKWPLRIQLPVGSHVPFHCTASGKMYLSTLQPRYLKSYLAAAELKPYTRNSKTDTDLLTEEIRRIRSQGYSTDDEEFMDGMAAIAVPVWDDMGRLLSTLAVHAPIQRNGLAELKAYLPLLQDAAEQLRLMVIN